MFSSLGNPAQPKLGGIDLLSARRMGPLLALSGPADMSVFGRFGGVTSTGRRNTGLKSFCRRLVAERHTRALVEFPCDGV